MKTATSTTTWGADALEPQLKQETESEKKNGRTDGCLQLDDDNSRQMQHADHHVFQLANDLTHISIHK